MKIKNLIGNNLKSIDYVIPEDLSIGIGGLSGSGKSTFCSLIANESIKRVVTMIPKSEYRFLFKNQLKSIYLDSFLSKEHLLNPPLFFV